MKGRPAARAELNSGAPDGSAGLWIGATASFLVASLAMVQIRSKIFGGYPSGDWPRDGYTWHFLPAFAACIALWVVAARLWSSRGGKSLREGMDRLGAAVAPLLGLVVAWSWYGLTGVQFHPAGGCHTPVLCHDVTPSSIVIWSAPWVVWAGWKVWRVWRTPAESA